MEKQGAICSFLYQLIDLFGRKVEAGTLIDFQSQMMILQDFVESPLVIA